MVFEKIENGEMLFVSVKHGASHIIDAIIPDRISTEDGGIYIEGENLILNITGEKEFIITFDYYKNKTVTYEYDIYAADHTLLPDRSYNSSITNSDYTNVYSKIFQGKTEWALEDRTYFDDGCSATIFLIKTGTDDSTDNIK